MKIELAGAVILDETERVLLIHRRDDPRQWELPGGKVEAGENPADAAVREVKEELGVSIRVIRHLGGTAFEQTGKEFDYEWYLATIENGTPRPLEPQHDDCRFVNLRQPGVGDIISPNVEKLAQAIQNEEIYLS